MNNKHPINNRPTKVNRSTGPSKQQLPSSFQEFMASHECPYLNAKKQLINN